MLPHTLLESIALILAITHFGAPLTYYYYLKKKWLARPWNLKTNPNHTPRIAVIVPTYNEAKLIRDKLDNIYRQEYPRDKLEVIVVDSASTDGTPRLVREWAGKHPDLKLKLVEEPVRRGMIPALNYALRHVSKNTEIIVFTDVDAFWDHTTLRKVISYFADPTVGAVSTCITPLEDNGVEKTYRDYYNVVRLAESKIHSTPIHNGALIAYRRELLERIGGLPTYTGNNDSTPASIIAFMGYRAIQINDTIVKEPIREKQVIRKIRRAQHLILSFIYTRSYAKKLGVYKRTSFEKIWRIEVYLHVVNPWLLLIAAVLLILSASTSLTALIMLSLGLVLLALKTYRTWILNQLYLIIAFVRNFKTKEIAWSK